MALLEPKDVTLTDLNGEERYYRVGKVPYAAGGRRLAVEAIAKLKKLEYIDDPELARVIFSHIAAIADDGAEIILKTDALVNNHVPDIPTGLRLEMELVEHNTGFSIAGKVREFQQVCMRSTKQLNSITSTLSQLASSLAAVVPGKSSEPSTPSRTLS